MSASPRSACSKVPPRSLTQTVPTGSNLSLLKQARKPLCPNITKMRKESILSLNMAAAPVFLPGIHRFHRNLKNSSEDVLHLDISARTLHPDRQEALFGWTPFRHFCPYPTSEQARSPIWMDSITISTPSDMKKFLKGWCAAPKQAFFNPSNFKKRVRGWVFPLSKLFSPPSLLKNFLKGWSLGFRLPPTSFTHPIGFEKASERMAPTTHLMFFNLFY